MKLFSVIILLSLSLSGTAKSAYCSFMNVTVRMPDSTEAAVIIKQKDNNIDNFSDFDIKARFQDGKPHTSADYYAFAAKQMQTWRAAEIDSIKDGFKQIEDYLRTNKLNINFPDTIVFIKSTCKEEFSAGGYTRKNFIVINREATLAVSLIAHELFHVLSRHNPGLRDSLYQNIGFSKCNVIDVREAMKGLNITNPDCPVISHYITIAEEDMVLALHSTKPYVGGNLFEEDYIAISLLVLKGDEIKSPKMKDGKPVLYSLENKRELFSIIGTNTPYVLHPEEICAEHFSALVTGAQVKEPVYLEAMKEDMVR